MSHLLVIADLINPVFNLIHVLLMFGLSTFAIYSLQKRFDLILALFTAGSILSGFITTIWFIFALQTDWKITLLSIEVRRIAYLFIHVFYPLEILIWASVFILLIKKNFISVLPATKQ